MARHYELSENPQMSLFFYYHGVFITWKGYRFLAKYVFGMPWPEP